MHLQLDVRLLKFRKPFFYACVLGKCSLKMILAPILGDCTVLKSIFAAGFPFGEFQVSP